jgi:hypothetical protein
MMPVPVQGSGMAICSRGTFQKAMKVVVVICSLSYTLFFFVILWRVRWQFSEKGERMMAPENERQIILYSFHSFIEE